MNTMAHRPSTRVAAIDAYRGFVMFLMMAEVLHLNKFAWKVTDGDLWMSFASWFSRVGINLPGNSIWQFLAYHQTHAEWAGCSLHDLIQPSFSFLVGVAVPFSIVSRSNRGQSTMVMIAHATWRALVLVLLGVFLRSVSKPLTYWTFEDTLSQIGLGYVPLFLLGLAVVGVGGERHVAPQGPNGETPGAQSHGREPNGSPYWFALCCAALAIILIGYWAVFALYPLPGPDFDLSSVGVPSDWSYSYSGFAAHWNKNTNLAWAFDTWFLNLFLRDVPFTHNGGGYATLSFVPTLGTMILGLMAGEWLRRANMRSTVSPASPDSIKSKGLTEGSHDRNNGSSQATTAWKTVGWFTVAGLVCLAAGYTLDRFGICPSVKRIWTPAWTLFSGGWCFILLAAFYMVMEAMEFRAWSFPLRVIGANSIAAYCIAHLWGSFIISSFKTHLGAKFFTFCGDNYELLMQGLAVLLVYWLILLWMYWRKIFLRI
jgi:heparan-alpha-glucosaminide N-acetyltransferase